MHRKKEEVILRILAQESLNLELWLKRYECLKFWSYFCGFSEARDLFVNIFRISDRTEKFVDRGLISENPRGLSVKSAKSGPRVNFTKVQGPLCKNAGEFSAGNYFAMDKSLDWVHVSMDRPGVLGRPWIDTGADRGHDGVLTGAWPPAAPVRLSSPAGAQNGEGSTRSSARAPPELGRRCGSRETVVQNREAAALGEDTTQACREGKERGKGVVLLGGGARLL
jgi:hypothetical protein